MEHMWIQNTFFFFTHKNIIFDLLKLSIRTRLLSSMDSSHMQEVPWLVGFFVVLNERERLLDVLLYVCMLNMICCSLLKKKITVEKLFRYNRNKTQLELVSLRVVTVTLLRWPHNTVVKINFLYQHHLIFPPLNSRTFQWIYVCL